MVIRVYSMQLVAISCTLCILLLTECIVLYPILSHVKSVEVGDLIRADFVAQFEVLPQKLWYELVKLMGITQLLNSIGLLWVWV